MNDPKPQLHVSGMELLSDCGQAWYFSYREGIKTPPSGALVVGNATHTSIELNVGNVIEEGEPLAKEQALEIARDVVHNKFELDVVLEAGQTKDEAKGLCVDLAVGLSGLHHGFVAPSLSPIAVEKPWVLHAKGYPFDLAGTWDLIERGMILRDAKTLKRAMSQADADAAVQFSGYASAYKIINGALPRRMVYDCLVKTKEPKYVPVETSRDNDDVQLFLRRFEAACVCIEKEIYLPASPKHWRCSPKWCSYHAAAGGPCQYTKGKRRPKS